MTGFRFSIATLLGVVCFAAVEVASMRAASDLWDSILFSATLALLLISTLLAVHRPDRRRAFWVGFALFGSAYLVASLVTPVESRLLTTRALASLAALRQNAPPGSGLGYLEYDDDGDLDLFVSNFGDGKFRRAKALAATPQSATLRQFLALGLVRASPGGTSENFVRIGHTILALMMGFVGAHLSRLVYAVQCREHNECKDST